MTGMLLVTLLAGVGSIGSSAYLSDSETNGSDTFATATSWSKPTPLDDGFEGDPWDANWDDNGTTLWQQQNNQAHSGTWSANGNFSGDGPITTDDLDASSARWIRVDFWFRPIDLDSGDILVQIYNGSTYNTWYDIADYATYLSDQWCYFSEYITDSQYLRSDFRLRLTVAGTLDGVEELHVDDVLITMLTVP